MSHPIPFLEEQNHAKNQLQSHAIDLHTINSTLLIRQLPSQGLSFQLWPAATSLVSLLDTPSSPISSLFPSQPRLLELGSGTGLVGIAAAALLGASVTVTDLPHVLPNLQNNIEANATVVGTRGGAVRAEALPWGDMERMEGIGREYDVILGSDVVYHDHLYEPLIETLKFFLLGSERRVVFLMAHLKRWKKEAAFFRKARKFFNVEVVHTDSPVDGARVGISVCRSKM